MLSIYSKSIHNSGYEPIMPCPLSCASHNLSRLLGGNARDFAGIACHNHALLIPLRSLPLPR